VDATLRFSVFPYIVSGVLASISGVGAQGVFCKKHRQQEAAKWSLLTGVLGWWSLGGIIATPIVLTRNLRGGSQNSLVNAQLLQAAAEALAERGDLPQATRALETAERLRPTVETAARLAEIRGY
jgi:hypothetical protein